MPLTRGPINNRFHLKKFFQIQLRFWRLIVIGGVLTSLATLTGFLSAHWWIFDLTAHFRIQYALSLAIASVILLVFRQARWATAFFAFSCINVLLLMPFYFGRPRTSQAETPRIRVLLINVRTENVRFDLVRKLIQEKKPDLVLLEEVNDRWLAELEVLNSEFPHAVRAAREDNFGIALLSKIPLTNAEVIYIGTEEVPSVIAEFEFEKKRLTFLGTHPVPPSGRTGTLNRNDQLRAVAKLLNAQTNPVILLGDLNNTPWSAHFRYLLRDARLKNTAIGFGVQPTWPSYFLPMRIPIDHCLVSPSLEATQRDVCGSVGSDHLPLLIELEISPDSKK